MPSYVKHMISFGLGALLATWLLQLCAQDTVDENPNITLEQYYFGGN